MIRVIARSPDRSGRRSNPSHHYEGNGLLRLPLRGMARNDRNRCCGLVSRVPLLRGAGHELYGFFLVVAEGEHIFRGDYFLVVELQQGLVEELHA